MANSEQREIAASLPFLWQMNAIIINFTVACAPPSSAARAGRERCGAANQMTADEIKRC